MQQQQMITSVNTGPPPSQSGQPPIQWVVAPPQQPQQPVYTYPGRLSMQLGVTMIICGVLSIVFNIVDLAVSSRGYDDYYYYSSLGFVGHGFWSGVMCATAGSLGVVAGRTRTACMIRASLVLSILAACLALGQLVTSLIGASLLGTYNLEDECCTDCHYHNYYYGRDNHGYCRKVQTLIAMESLLALMSLVGGICAIVLSSMGCRAACCCRGQTVVYSGYPMTVLPGGIQVTNMSQQQGPPMAGYQYQYPVAGYGAPPAGYQYPPPPPGYNPQQPTPVGEEKRQQMLQ